MTDNGQQRTDLRPKTKTKHRILKGETGVLWRVTNHEALRRTPNGGVTSKAFTLIELVVAVALLAMMLGFASVIFRVSIEAYRTAGANTEIMQKLRAVTDQLNADFKGQIWNPPGRINFGFDSNNVRSDSIIFFANGDFQSTGQYPYMKSGGGEGLKTISGNVATIFYGQADTSTSEPEEKILVRRQTIITSDTSLTNDFDLDELGEYCNTQSLADLIADPLFDANALMVRPDWDANDLDANDLVMYMAKGVDNFAIQYVGTEDPDQGKEFNVWRPENKDVRDGWPLQLFPLALKFTFTLYDSRGIFENGRRFTHIVYVGN